MHVPYQCYLIRLLNLQFTPKWAKNKPKPTIICLSQLTIHRGVSELGNTIPYFPKQTNFIRYYFGNWDCTEIFPLEA